MFAELIFKTIGAFRRVYLWSLNKYYKKRLNIESSVRLGFVKMDKKNITIAKGTYIQSGEIFSGDALVTIGKYCAIGKNVSIKARTHDLTQPTPDEINLVNKQKFANISIGDRVWIGDNVFIKEGINIGNAFFNSAFWNQILHPPDGSRTSNPMKTAHLENCEIGSRTRESS